MLILLDDVRVLQRRSLGSELFSEPSERLNMQLTNRKAFLEALQQTILDTERHLKVSTDADDGLTLQRDSNLP
jgi:hypothetical protein